MKVKNKNDLVTCILLTIMPAAIVMCIAFFVHVIDEVRMSEAHTDVEVVYEQEQVLEEHDHSAEEEVIINPEELEMLAIVIYQEAGSDHICDDCRRMVADVVLNRIADTRFPNTMFEVLTAKRQYGTMYIDGIVWPDRASNPGEEDAVNRAYAIADEVLHGVHSELYGNGYIWQAEFEQGSEGFWHCNIYFGK